MYNIEDIKKKISTVSDEKLDQAISKGTLNLTDSEIGTVSFVFWLCHVSEKDIEAAIRTPWDKLSRMFSSTEIGKAKTTLNNIVYGERSKEGIEEILTSEVSSEVAKKIRKVIEANYKEKPNPDIDSIPYFADKIKLYEKIFFKNNVAEFLWKINSIRNDISHGRYAQLSYDGKSLNSREGKEKILIDYLEAFNNPDHSKSNLKNKLQEKSNDELSKQILSSL